MAVPTSYTEDEVKTYMEVVLGDTAHKLGFLADDGDFDEAVNEVLLILDESDFSFVDSGPEVLKVRTVARQEAWRVAMNSTVHEIAHSVGAPGTGQTSRADIHRHAKAMFELARAEVFEKYPELSPEGSIEVTGWTVQYAGDYYGNQAD